MEPISFPIIPSAFILTCILVATHFLLKTILHRGSVSINGGTLSVPPGKMGLPFLGESMAFVLSFLSGRPETFVLDRVKQYSSNTFKSTFMRDPVVVMHGAAGNKFLFSNEGKLVKAWCPTPVQRLIPSSNVKTFRVRDIAQPILTPVGVRNRIGTMDRMAKLHLEVKWRGRQQVKVHPLGENYAFSLACQLFMSINDQETVEGFLSLFSTLSKGLVSLYIDLPWTRFGRAMRASRLAVERLKVIIRKRRVEMPQDGGGDDDSTNVDDDDRDMLSLLLFATNELGEHMNDNEIADRLMGFLIAGHDTFSNVFTMILSFLADHPDIYDKVLQENLKVAATKESGELLNWEDTRMMRYSWDVAREVMRIYPPAPAIQREAVDDFSYDGYRIPKGWKIHINVPSMHKDPKIFPHPEKFDPSRFEGAGPLPYTYVPFGGGPRMCPAMDYIQSVILVFLHNFITRFKWKKIHANEAVVYTPYPRPVYGLPVRLEPLLATMELVDS